MPTVKLNQACLGRCVRVLPRTRDESDERFGNWEVGETIKWDSPESLRPVRIVLVDLGADESAQRMADWLVAKGVEIDLLTFLGYRHEERLLLARQLASSDEVRRQE